jgi:hypothetical protein
MDMEGDSRGSSNKVAAGSKRRKQRQCGLQAAADLLNLF